MPDELEWHGEKVLAILNGTNLEGLELGAEHLLQVSSDRAPLEEGDLARSGTATSDPQELAAAVAFDRPYAVRQHEELTWRHDQGRTAKYLEDPMNEEQETLLELIAGPSQDALGG